MSNIPLPALALRTPQPENPLDQMRRMVELRSLLKSEPIQQQIQQQQLQAAQLENQQRALQMQREKALSGLYARGSGDQNGSAGSSGQNGKQSYVMPTDDEVLAAGGPVYGTAILKNMKELQKSNADLQAAYAKHQSEALDYMGNVAGAIKAGGYNPDQANQLLDHAAALPGFGDQVKQFQQQIGNDSLRLRQMVDQAISMSPKQRELGAQEMTAQARKQQADIATQKAGMDIPGSQYVPPSVPGNGATTGQPSQQTSDPMSPMNPMNLRLAGGYGFDVP